MIGRSGGYVGPGSPTDDRVPGGFFGCHYALPTPVSKGEYLMPMTVRCPRRNHRHRIWRRLALPRLPDRTADDASA